MKWWTMIAWIGTWVFCAAAWAQTRPATREARPAGGEVVFEDDFQTMDNWVSEGPHLVQIEKGHLHVKTVQDDRQVGQYIWCKRELPADFRIEFDVTPASKSGFFLIFFCVQGVKGEDILGEDLFERYMNWRSWKPYDDWDKYTSSPQRTGHHQSRLLGYHISYRRNEVANCNLRKNPGLVLKKSSLIETLMPQNQRAHVALSKQGGHVTLIVNGQIFMDWTDDHAPWQGGRFGFRNVYDSDALYDDVKIFDLDPGAARP